MAEAASFLEFLLQVYVQWSKDLQRDGWHQAGTTSITGLPRGVLLDYHIILPPLVLLYYSSACITGYFCSTAWSNGTGLSFRQCITLLQINIRREMKLSWAFVCGPCSLCQLSEQGVGELVPSSGEGLGVNGTRNQRNPSCEFSELLVRICGFVNGEPQLANHVSVRMVSTHLTNPL